MRIRTLLTLTAFAAVSSLCQAQKPVVYFSFESIQGGQILDQSGNNLNAKIVGDVTIVDGGKIGKAAKFANKGYLDLDGVNIPAALIPKDEISLVAWINVTNTGDHHEIFNARASDATFIVHPEYRSDNSWRWLFRDTATIFEVKSTTGAQTGVWVHFAGTYHAANAVGALYVNGVKVGEQQLDQANPRPMQQDWKQGARVGMTVDNARPFTGLMDEFAIFAKALTEAETKRIMDNGIAPATAVEAFGKTAVRWATLKRNAFE
jgi:hypothetical protein